MINVMGMLASYMMIEEEKIAPFEKLEGEQLVEYFMGLEEAEVFESIDLDKLWDALHCFCTNVSAANPIEGNKLSEAIVGVHVLSEEEFIACTENSELEEIISAMKAFDFPSKKASFDFKIFEQQEIYPHEIWKEDKTNLLNELEKEFYSLLAFYEKTFKMEYHIMVSIL